MKVEGVICPSFRRKDRLGRMIEDRKGIQNRPPTSPLMSSLRKLIICGLGALPGIACIAFETWILLDNTSYAALLESRVITHIKGFTFIDYLICYWIAGFIRGFAIHFGLARIKSKWIDPVYYWSIVQIAFGITIMLSGDELLVAFAFATFPGMFLSDVSKPSKSSAVGTAGGG